MTWSPKDENIAEGATIEHRVFLDDGGPTLDPTILKGIVFRPFWDRMVSDHQSMLWTIGIATASTVLYLLPRIWE